MRLTITYKNELGTVVMKGGGNASSLRITDVEGLGLVAREYNVAVYAGYDGQETLGSRAAARTITIALEVNSRNAVSELRSALHAFSREGMLYIKNSDIDRRIKCNQVQAPDITRVIRGEIATFVVQFVCDSPYFEDAEDTSVALYRRTKCISSPFVLPMKFGEIVKGANVEILGLIPTEPIITMHWTEEIPSVEYITLINKTTGKSITLNYSPKAEETVVIDVKNRKITSDIYGNLINYLSRESFLGDFVLQSGINVLDVDMGDMNFGFTIECRYNNLYSEAVIV